MSRSRYEWYNAIMDIIRAHGGCAEHINFYSEIPKILTLTERELSESTVGANKELRWRGTLRGHITDMVQQDILVKEYLAGKRNRPLFKINGSKR